MHALSVISIARFLATDVPTANAAVVSEPAFHVVKGSSFIHFLFSLFFLQVLRIGQDAILAEHKAFNDRYRISNVKLAAALVTLADVFRLV